MQVQIIGSVTSLKATMSVWWLVVRLVCHQYIYILYPFWSLFGQNTRWVTVSLMIGLSYTSYMPRPSCWKCNTISFLSDKFTTGHLPTINEYWLYLCHIILNKKKNRIHSRIVRKKMRSISFYLLSLSFKIGSYKAVQTTVLKNKRTRLRYVF